MKRSCLHAALVPLLAVVLLGIVPGAAETQEPQVYRLSQRAAVVQHLANTVVRVEYSRPAARGRSPLFGNVVHYGEVWTPGANEATVLELSGEATIDGHEVPAGRWSMWMIPSEVAAWELLLHPVDTLFHTMRPEIGAEGQIRFEVRDEVSEPFAELLTWDFPAVDRHTATLRMTWGETVVPLAIEVEPNLPETVVSEDEAARYAGEWTVRFELPPGAPADGEIPDFTATIWHDERGLLRFDVPWEVMSPPSDEEPLDASASARERERAEGQRAAEEQLVGWYYVALVPFAEGIFRQAFFLSDHTLVDVENGFLEFELDGDGPATGLVVRAADDRVIARATRGG
jgi:hypothetical protein